MKTACFAGIVGIGIALPLCAATVTFPAVADTSLFEGKPDSDLGATTLVAGTNQIYSRARALFRFDLASLPPGALVISAEVSLYVTRQPDPDQHGGPVESDFSLFRLFVSWGEGTGSGVTGSTAMPGDATWNERHAGVAGWGTPGGLIGVDFAGSASATTGIGGVGSYLWESTPGLVGDVQSWLATPSANFGFLLMSQGESALGSARRFGAKEQPGGLIPPARLTVTYDIPEASAAFLLAAGLAVLCLRRSKEIPNQ